jgi:hypothetical protein
MFGVTLLKNFFFFGCRCFAQSLNGHTATTTTTAFLGEKKDRGTPPFHLEPKFRLQS